ncbi:MAG: Gfo/Idh/MocA family oxidoreductase [Chloroflexota bacterium]
MIRIGIVGCGRILNAHLQGYKLLRELGMDNFRITALCARKEEDALMFRKRGEGPPPRPPVLDPSTGDPLAAPHTYLDDFQPDTDVAVFTDYKEMIASDLVDAVNDFTTLYLHHMIGQDALNAGLHLLTQKPLAISVRAGKLLVDLANEKGLTLGVFENVRQAQGVRAAAWAVQTGVIGDFQMAVLGSVGGLWSPDKIVAETPWRHRKLEAGGGGAIDIGVHAMHWAAYVCGDIESVHASVRTFEPTRAHRDDAGNVQFSTDANVDDTYFATINFANGGIGQLLWSWAGHGEALAIPGAPAFYGSKGCIKGGEVILDDGTRTPVADLFEAEASDEVKQQFYPLGLDARLRDPYAIQQYDWLKAIETGGQPETDGMVGVMDLAAAFGMIESSQARRTVTMDEMVNGEVDAYQREIDAHYGLI